MHIHRYTHTHVHTYNMFVDCAGLARAIIGPSSCVGSRRMRHFRARKVIASIPSVDSFSDTKALLALAGWRGAVRACNRRVIAAHFARTAVNVRQLNCVLISLKRARFKYYHFDLDCAQSEKVIRILHQSCKPTINAIKNCAKIRLPWTLVFSVHESTLISSLGVLKYHWYRISRYSTIFLKANQLWRPEFQLPSFWMSLQQYQFKSVIWGSNLCNVALTPPLTLALTMTMRMRRGMPGAGDAAGSGECQLALLKLKIPPQWVDRKMKHIRLDQVEAFKSDTHFSSKRHNIQMYKCMRVCVLTTCMNTLFFTWKSCANV